MTADEVLEFLILNYHEPCPLEYITGQPERCPCSSQSQPADVRDCMQCLVKYRLQQKEESNAKDKT